jgi:hypothetical protein
MKHELPTKKKRGWCHFPLVWKKWGLNSGEQPLFQKIGLHFFRGNGPRAMIPQHNDGTLSLSPITTDNQSINHNEGGEGHHAVVAHWRALTFWRGASRAFSSNVVKQPGFLCWLPLELSFDFASPLQLQTEALCGASAHLALKLVV